MLILPKGYSAPAVVSADWLKDRPLLLLDDGHCLREHTLSLCSLPAGLQSPFRATSLGTMVQMVSSGFGLSIVPSMAVDVETARADIEVRPIDDSGIGRTLRLAYAASHPLAGRLAEVAAELENLVEGLPAV